MRSTRSRRCERAHLSHVTEANGRRDRRPFSFPAKGGADMASTTSDTSTISEHELAQVERANASGLQSVAFVHGLWLLPSSWDQVGDAVRGSRVHRRHPRAGRTTRRRSRRRRRTRRSSPTRASARSPTTSTSIVSRLDQKPAVIGHSFGGLLAQILAGRGLAAVSVAIDPAPFRGVLPLPISALRSASPVLEEPGQPQPAVPLTYDQFRYSFANAVDEDEAKELLRDVSRCPAPACRSSRPRRRT